MPKPDLREPYASLESDLFATMQAGLHEWRKDLDYPESFSDFQACFRALFRMYEVKRRPLAIGMDAIEELPDLCGWCGRPLGGEVCSGPNYFVKFCTTCGYKLNDFMVGKKEAKI